VKEKDALNYYKKYERAGRTLSFEEKLYIEVGFIRDAYLSSTPPTVTPMKEQPLPASQPPIVVP